MLPEFRSNTSMHSRRLKTGFFVLEGLNSFATIYYFYYFYFFMQRVYGYGNKANLVLAAVYGAFCTAASWWGGKFGQRYGYFTALKVGFGLMALALAPGPWVPSAAGQIVIFCLVSIGVCITWPSLEALVSEGEPRLGLQQMIGIYNVVWAGTAALANFFGGAMLQMMGGASLFYVPMAMELFMLLLVFWLESRAAGSSASTIASAHFAEAHAGADGLSSPHSTARSKSFLRMAWLANPFAYIAINTVVAVIPGVAQRLGLSTMMAGFWCSIWGFARVGAFVALWVWPGWHYRFRWMLVSYLVMIGTFAAVLVAPNLTVLLLAQLGFGVATGLIYYSSLFYSMDVGDTKGEHGGFHEAAIGLGNLAGPALGAAALQFMPAYSNSSTVAVSLLLVGGLGGLGMLWRSGNRS